MDRLAKRGLLFTNAHVPAHVCNPSRVAPQKSVIATFGIDLAKGPYVLEGATIAATLTVSGTLTGKASVGSLFKIDVTAQANINASAALTLSDFDNVANEKLYLFSTSGTDAIQFDEIVKQDKAVTIGGTANLNAALTVNNTASQIPAFGSLLPPSFTWNALASYNLTTGANSYVVQPDASFNAIVGLIKDTETAVVNLLAEKLEAKNPIPNEVRELLIKEIPIINKNLLEILNIPIGA